MAEYYRDGTSYSLNHFENAKNIGWIYGTENYDKGNVTSQFIDSLWMYVKNPFNETRENRGCFICCANSTIREKSSSNDFAALGSSEIRVISEDGKEKYAAPSMILHYVIEHNYCPPSDFIRAVIDGPKPGSYEYQTYQKRYNMECLWGESEETVVISEKLRHGVISNDRKLINDNPDFCNIITRDGSLLNVAIKAGNLELAEDLVLLGIDLDRFSGIELNNAVFESENQLVRLLLSKNIMIDVSSPKRNPLFTAIRKGNYEASYLLLENGIDVNVKYTNEFMKNMDALTLAKHCKQEDIARLIAGYI